MIDHEVITRAFFADTGRWSIWYYAVVDGRMRLTTTRPSRLWTERELKEDIGRHFTLRPIGMLLGPFVYAFTVARQMAVNQLAEEELATYGERLANLGDCGVMDSYVSGTLDRRKQRLATHYLGAAHAPHP